MRISDLVLGLLLLVGGGVLVVAAQTYPDLPNQTYGAATFPFVIGLGFLALGAILIGGTLVGGRLRTEPPVSLVGWGRVRASWLRLGAVLGLVVGYIVLAPTLGFLLSAGGLLFGLLMVFRARLWVAALVTVPAVFAFAQVFGVLLRVPLPRATFLTGLW